MPVEIGLFHGVRRKAFWELTHGRMKHSKISLCSRLCCCTQVHAWSPLKLEPLQLLWREDLCQPANKCSKQVILEGAFDKLHYITLGLERVKLPFKLTNLLPGSSWVYVESFYPSNLFHRSSGVSSPHPILSLSQARHLPSVVAISAPTVHVPSREFCLYWFFLLLVICGGQTSDSLGRWKSQSLLPIVGADRGGESDVNPLPWGSPIPWGIRSCNLLEANTSYEMKQLSS